ncbi:MAG: RNA polymerase factor sigma-54 [Candidatus Marinimicrobia bacterium]|nr:RNA polymerase factor sigma-54 [Candidatus Neomarinimicrobiota bacterium]
MKLSQKQILKQKLSPKQILLSKLIQLPTDSLESEIENELEANPVLEIDEDATKSKQEKDQSNENTTDDSEQPYDWEDLYSSNNFKPVSTYDASKIEPNIPQEEKKYFIDKLLDQIYQSGLEEQEIQIAEELIGDLDSAGYLTTPLENQSYKLDVPIEIIKKVLKVIHKLEPIGVGARNLQECLLLQMEEIDTETFVVEIVKNYFEEFANHDYEKIMKSMNITKQDLQYAKSVISKLNPKPGFVDDEFSNHYVLPDLIVIKKDGDFIVKHNDSHLPELKLSTKYKNMIANKQNLDKETSDYLQKKLYSATMFIDSIMQRRTTMIKVMSAIIELQRDFFSDSNRDIIPMKLDDVAKKIDMDISTVSRVTNGKYVQTPFGLFELKTFFSEGLENEDGKLISRNKIMKDLKTILDSEDKNSPLTDEELMNKLNEKGYKIARRTVAKYREKLNIQNAKLRRGI